MTKRTRHRMRGTLRRVEAILTDIPATRNSDRLLYAVYLERTFGHEILTQPVGAFLMARNIPSIETVGRMRRLAQTRNPELNADDEIERERRILEAQYMEIPKEFY